MSANRKKKNQPEPQARLDLHGFTVEIAYGQVKAMLLRYQDRGYTLVEIVTGKSGRIRAEFPFWMESLGYKATVAKHGGSFIVKI